MRHQLNMPWSCIIQSQRFTNARHEIRMRSDNHSLSTATTVKIIAGMSSPPKHYQRNLLKNRLCFMTDCSRHWSSLQIPPDLSLIEYLRDMFEQAWSSEAPACIPQTCCQSHGARRYTTPSGVLCPCPDMSEMLWKHRGKIHNTQ